MEASEANRNELVMLLSEVAPPNGRFSLTELDYLLGKSEDVYEAASYGWTMKADKLIETGGLVTGISVGSESYRFASLQDLEGYCKRKSLFYARQSSSPAMAGSGGLIVSISDAEYEGLVLDSSGITEV